MIFHVITKLDRYRTMCGVRGDKAPVMASLALLDDPDWIQVQGAICADCARMMKPGKTLWAVAVEKLVVTKTDGRSRRQWVPDGITYVHADDELKAIEEWSHNTERNTRLVACGRVIGYHVEDTNGLVLSA
jgi:hypothetical protein